MAEGAAVDVVVVVAAAAPIVEKEVYCDGSAGGWYCCWTVRKVPLLFDLVAVPSSLSEALVAASPGAAATCCVVCHGQ